MLQDEAEAEPKSVRWKRAKARLKKPACQTKTKATELAVNRYVDDLRNYTGAADHPDWAAHVVSILGPYLRSLPKLCSPCLRLHVWADCAGLCSEMCAAREVEQSLRRLLGVDVKFILHGACDECPHSKKFVMQNYAPKHWSDDICDRDWETGAYTDTTADPAVCRQLPDTSIDIYVAGWPCGPFNHRGVRKRGADAKGGIIWSVINSI